MKICYMGNIDAVHTQRWAKAFAKMGHDVHVVYMGGEENNIMDLKKAGISVHLLNSQVLTNSFVGYTKSTEKSSGLSYVGRHFYRRLPEWITTPLKIYLVNPRRLRNLLKKIQPDILHAWFLYDSGCIAALSRYRPLVVSSWGTDVTFNSFDNGRSLWMLKWANRFCLKKADVITATSKWLADRTAEYAPKGNTIQIVPFGIDCEEFNPVEKKIENGTVTLGFAKHLLPKYGPDTLIEAFVHLKDEYPFLRLKMAGEGYMLAELERRVRAFDVENRVTFMGKIPHSEMPRFLSEVDIAIQPSRRNSESFGVAALEASAMEIPVVSTRVGGVPECIKDGKTGILVKPDDAKALSEAIAFLIENPQKGKEMGKAGRKFVLQNYRWQDNTKAMMEIYQQTLLYFNKSR